MQTDLGDLYYVKNVAMGGETLPDMITQGAAQVDAIFDASKENVAFLEGGTNDISAGRTPQQIHDDTETWCLARKAAGYQVILFSLPIFYCAGASCISREAIRQETNALIAADWADYADAYIDLDTLDMYPDYPGPYDPTLFVDGLHPTSAGTAILAGAAQVALAGLIP